MKINEGDIILVHNKSIVGRLIQVGMQLIRFTTLKTLWKIVRGKEPIWKFLWNHGEMGRRRNTVQGAIETGVKTRISIKAFKGMKKADSLDEAKKKYKKKIVVRYSYNWDLDQLVVGEVIAKQIEDTVYQFDNFLLYLVYILSLRLIWLGRQSNKADNAIYCTEANSMKMFYMTSPNLATKETDHSVHFKLRKYWIGHPLVQQEICEKYCKLEDIYYI